MTDHLDPHDLDFLDRLAETCDPVAPPPAVRARVLDSIRTLPQLDSSVPSADVPPQRRGLASRGRGGVG